MVENLMGSNKIMGFPGGASGKEIAKKQPTNAGEI